MHFWTIHFFKELILLKREHLTYIQKPLVNGSSPQLFQHFDFELQRLELGFLRLPAYSPEPRRSPNLMNFHFSTESTFNTP